ncbi:MAG: hypothetical protein IJV00_05980 [Clostridia bacterium]|nr:hypothetical protein [Clostridia bacterium]
MGDRKKKKKNQKIDPSGPVTAAAEADEGIKEPAAEAGTEPETAAEPESDGVLEAAAEAENAAEESAVPEEDDASDDDGSPGSAEVSDGETASETALEAVESSTEVSPDPDEKASDAADESQISDDLAYRVLGPQSVFAQLVQLLLGAIPIIGAPLIALWVFFGGTTTSVALVSAPPALALAILAFWACGGCANVNRRRFARAYFLALIVGAALIALAVLLAVSFGFRFSPVLKRLLTPYL